MNINLDTAKDTLCKNILIYGYCKFENKGCAFSHNRQQPQQPQPTTNNAANTPNSANSTVSSSTESSNKKKYNLNTPSFQPSVSNLSSKFSNLSPKLKEIPVFKPENGAPTNNTTSNATATTTPADHRPYTSKKFNVSTPSFTPSSFEFGNSNGTSNNTAATSSPLAISSAPPLQNQSQSTIHAPLPTNSHLPPGLPTNIASSSNSYFPISTPTPGQQQQPQPPLSLQQPSGPGTPGPALGQAQNQGPPQQPVQYHLYAPAPPPRLTIPLQPHELNSQAMFIPNDLREYLHKKNEASLQSLSHSNLPDHVNQYHSLVPIDKSYEPISKLWLGKNSLIFKVYNNFDGNLYAMRKIEPCNEIINDKPFKTIKKWKSINNANIVGLQDAFTTMAFNNNGTSTGNTSLCIVYDYYPNSISLLEHHKKGLNIKPITEDLLWNYLIQLINALTSIHGKGLSAKSTINLSKIVVTNKNRIRLSSVGISDILEYDEQAADEEIDIKEEQLQDIKNVAKILIELSVLLLPLDMRQSNNIFNSLKSSTNLSEEFVNVLQELSEATKDSFVLEEFYKKISHKMITIINNLQDSNDFMEGQLGSELENGRLFRLMSKLNYLLYKNTNENDKILRLFMKYIYNCYDNQKKIINLNKVLINLNKLDCGIDEKILLINNDDCIIVSYKELKEIVDYKFRMLRE
ncbi:PAN3 PAN2-PAN3 deadenylation complex subunit PAN3 [Candida maltosa Xu316]